MTLPYQIDQQVRGTRIISGDQARERRLLLNKLILVTESCGFAEIILPSIEPAGIYINKAGAEILNQMYTFPDKKQRKLCLRPEATATIQLLADKYFQDKKERKFWYFERCWRYERPQAGRWREFFQFGVEIINPKNQDTRRYLIDLAIKLIKIQTSDIFTYHAVKRGLDYYTSKGFEITCPQLGANKQICGGGAYKQGIGFAIGFDRLMLCK